MGICSYVHFIKALKSKLNLLILFCILWLNLFGCWVRRLKVTKHFIYPIYSLAAVPARSQVVLPSKRRHVIPKACHTGLHYTQGIYKEASLATGLHTNYPCPFCHTDFINQEEVIEHMEICSVTDPEANRSSLPANH